jgi:hypothetical protein
MIDKFVFQSLILLVSGFITDIVWALYIRKVSENKRLQASFLSVGTGICTIIFVKGLLTNFWLTFPWLVGLFFGTFYSNNLETFFKKLREKI